MYENFILVHLLYLHLNIVLYPFKPLLHQGYAFKRSVQVTLVHLMYANILYITIMCYLERVVIEVMTVRLRLRELRTAKEVTQREMAALLNTTETNYRRLEGQKISSISYTNLDTLCKFFSCTPNEILEFTND